MVLRHIDSRRRRIVVDPHQHESDVVELTSAKSARKRKKTLYKAGADRRSQWKTTDLIPKRTWVVSLLIIMLLASLVGLNLLHHYAPKWVDYLGTGGIAALNLSGQATLAAWFSSFLLIISGFASLQIYALRQHRQDDYRGSYRLWLWMSALLLLASINCVVDLTSMGAQLIHRLTQLSLSQSVLGMLTFKLVLLSVLVARGSFEVRESRWSLSLVVLVWCAYVAAMALRLPVLQPVMANVNESTLEIVHGNLILVGTVGLLMGHLVFARFVYLQALGTIKPVAKSSSKIQANGRKSSKVNKTKKPRAKKATESSEATDSKDSFSPTTVPAKPTMKANDPRPAPMTKTVADSKPTQGANRQGEPETDKAVLKLSKSEQRRLRKQQQSSHRRAA
jgi:hypothetical protein